MAIIANLELNGESIQNCYYKVTKLILSSSDEEIIEDLENGNSKLSYVKEYENIAYIDVYPDKESRQRNVIPLKKFAIFFDYDCSDLSNNPYNCAYDALTNTESLFGCEIIHC